MFEVLISQSNPGIISSTKGSIVDEQDLEISANVPKAVLNRSGSFVFYKPCLMY